MGIQIKLKRTKQSSGELADNAQFLTNGGEPIDGIKKAELLFLPEQVVAARLTVIVDECDIQNIHAQLGYESLKQLASQLGYSLVEKKD